MTAAGCSVQAEERQNRHDNNDQADKVDQSIHVSRLLTFLAPCNQHASYAETGGDMKSSWR
jgi:hypothetical protein